MWPKETHEAKKGRKKVGETGEQSGLKIFKHETTAEPVSLIILLLSEVSISLDSTAFHGAGDP